MEVGDYVKFMDSELGTGNIVALFEIFDEPCAAVALHTHFWAEGRRTYVTTLVASESNLEVI